MGYLCDNGGLIESDWNLKVNWGTHGDGRINWINRIRLEFKVRCFVRNPCGKLGLIESDWNLKLRDHAVSPACLRGLIESDWNLKDEGVVPSLD